MNRRSLFKKLGAAAAVAAVAPAAGVSTAEAASPPCAECEALASMPAPPTPAHYDMPSGTGPLLVKAAHDRATRDRIGHAEAALLVWAEHMPQSRIDAEPTEATTREWVFRPETDTTIVVNTHSYVAWQVEPLTFDDLAAGCGANGCHLERTYDIVRLRYEYAHWRDGDLWPDDTMTARGRDIEPVAAWLDGLHEREARRAGEELAGAVDDLATRTNPGAAMLTIEDFRNAVRMLDTNTFAAEAAGTSTFTLLPSHYGVEGQA